MHDWLLYYDQDVTLIWTKHQAPTGTKSARMTIDHLQYYRVYAAPVAKSNVYMAHTAIAFDHLKMVLGLDYSRPILVHAITREKKSYSHYLVWQRSSKDQFIKVSDLSARLAKENEYQIALRRVCGVGPYHDTGDPTVLVRGDSLLSFETKDYDHTSTSNFTQAHAQTLHQFVKGRSYDELSELLVSMPEPTNSRKFAIRSPMRQTITSNLPRLVRQLVRVNDMYSK